MNTYLLFKSLHLIAVISWMAGLLYLPRIFVYHSQNNNQPIISDVFKVMERKLFFYIMTPAMVLTWMILKLIFVVLLTIYHLYLGRVLGQFQLDLNTHSHKFYRFINEIPTLLLILIIFVVVFKPI